jgi:hypothetical protein
MAITIISSPNQFMAAYNQIPYTVSSNNTAQPNFNFIVDVNQTGGTNNPLARLKYPAQPSSSQLTFDVGNVVKNYVSFDFGNALAARIAANTRSRLNYFVQFRELYDNVSGIPTLSGVLASDPATPSSSVFKLGSNAIFDFEDYSPTAYIDCNVSGFGFLNADLSVSEQIEPTQNRILTFFDPNRVVTKIQLSANGIGPVEYNVTLPANEYLFNINAGKYLFDLYPGISFPTTILIRLLAGSVVVAEKGFTTNTDCSQYPTVRLHWLNKLGGFEAFNFNKNTINEMEIERKQFKAPLPIGYNKSDRLKTNYNTTINDKITINSDWISEEQSLLFEQLATSPIIYLERSATDFVAVNILNSSYEIKTFLTDRKMFNVTFEIEYSYSRYRQSL